MFFFFFFGLDLENVRGVRKRLGLTQAELAEASGVSQSLITKIENGRINPSYSKLESIWGVLEDAKVRNEPVAEELMVEDVVFCQVDDDIERVIKKMKSREISQLPVLDGSSLVGLVTESSLLDHVFDESVEDLLVEDVMEAAPPTVSKNTPESAFLPLLKHFPLVLVKEKGEFLGLVTKADLVREAYS